MRHDAKYVDEVRHMSSVPIAADRTGWQSRRVRRLPGPAAVYGAAIAVGAVVAALASGLEGDPTGTEWTSFAVLLPLCVAAPFFRVPLGRNYSLHTGSAFVVAGALVLPPLLVAGLVLALHVPQWVRESYPWYIHTFNLSNYTLSALAAWLTVDLIGATGDVRFAASGAGAAATFVLVNHALLGVMLRLGRGHRIRETGLFSPTGLGIELALASLGVALGVFAGFNPWLLPSLLAPLVLAHRSFSTIALLRESEERFRAMYESAPTAMLMLDLEGRLVAVNRSAVDLLGYEEDELLGRTTSHLRHPDDAAELAGMLGEMVRGERESFRVEARYVTKSARTVTTHLAVALVRDADGRPDYVIAMAEDVTERKHLEERLLQSQKLEAIGRLAGGVAHDFNNMLTAIGGYTALALDHAQGAELRGDLEEIRKATDRATLLTRQLLAFSRKQVLQPELLNLNGIVLELETMLRPLIGEDITLSASLDPALGPIEADPGQLHQVVMNLVVNARDAMPAGGAVTIQTANVQVDELGEDGIEPGRYVTLTVSDTGEGIDETTLGQIFEPFFTTKESGKGTGLGLATVYGIVKQSGGYVAVESEVGLGTAFTVYLLRADEARAAVEAPAPVLASAAPASVGTVLVVEDEEVVRNLVRQVLTNAGYRVLTAADGAEALELAASGRVDLLLTDLTMPGIDGRELASRLRASLPGLKVVFMSGYAEAGVLADGETGFLEKPFTFAALTASVGEILAPG